MNVAYHMLTWADHSRRHDEPLAPAAMLRDIADAGYSGVELVEGPTLLGPPAHARTLLADAGLEVAAYSSFVNATEWEPNTTKYRAELDYAAELGITTIMVCGGWLAEPRRAAFDDDYRAFADNLMRAQSYADQYGQVVAYHPHMGCIVETPAEVDRLLSDAPALRLCIDTGHLLAVRADPAELVRRYPDRIAHVHLKDWDPANHRFTELGAGGAGLDLPGFLDALADARYPGWLSVELDQTETTPRESALISARYLDSLTAPAHS